MLQKSTLSLPNIQSIKPQSKLQLLTASKLLEEILYVSKYYLYMLHAYLSQGQLDSFIIVHTISQKTIQDGWHLLLSLQKILNCQKVFPKAIMLDRSFLYARVGMAHSFAVQDQSDQAMSIYRTIVRLFPDCAQAHLYMGMQYLRTNNLKTATFALLKTKQTNPYDPLIYSQLGVISSKQQNYKEAKQNYSKALSLCHPQVSY